MYDAGDEFQDISISHSPKGWTDQELGEMWIKKDFEPATAAKNVTGGYHLLISIVIIHIVRMVFVNLQQIATLLSFASRLIQHTLFNLAMWLALDP